MIAFYLGTPQQSIATTTPQTLDDKIQILSEKYEVPAPLAEAIIWCESRKKADAEGKNLTKTGEVWSRDLGEWQLNDHYQADKLKEMGWDIHNPDDRLEAGFWLLKEEGTKPWKASKGCWSNPNLDIPA